MSSDRVPKIGGAAPARLRQPQVAPQARPTDEVTPVWKVAIMDKDAHVLGWQQCSKKRWFEILDNLGEYEKLTFAELGAQGCHPVPQERMKPDALARMRELKLDQVESLYSLRIMKKIRVWCLREGNLMYLLWYDPEHRVAKAKGYD